VQQTEWSRQYALSPSHELADSGCQNRTVSVVWTAQTSRAQDSAAIYLPGCISVWNPSKLPHRSSLGDPYLSRFFLPFLCFIPNVVTHFWTPCLLEDWQKQMKEIFFRNPVWAVFCSLYPSPLLPKSSGFLRLIRSLHNAKFISFLAGL